MIFRLADQTELTYIKVFKVHLHVWQGINLHNLIDLNWFLIGGRITLVKRQIHGSAVHFRSDSIGQAQILKCKQTLKSVLSDP